MTIPGAPFANLPALKQWLGAQDPAHALTLEPGFFQVPAEPGPSALFDRLFERLGPLTTLSLTSWRFTETPGTNIVLAGTSDVINVPGTEFTATFTPSAGGASLVALVGLKLSASEQWEIHSLLRSVHLDNIRITLTPDEVHSVYTTAFEADLNAGQLKIPIGVHVPPYEADWVAHASFEVQGAPGISTADMISLAAGHDFTGDLQSPKLTALLNAARLRDMRIDFDPSAATLSEIDFVIVMPGPWDFASNLSARDLALEVVVPFRGNRPFDPFVIVRASMDVGSGAAKVALDIEAQFPDLHVAVSLDPSTQISLAAVFHHFNIDLPSWLGDPQITVLRVDVDLENDSQDFRAVVNSDVELIPGLALKSLHIELAHATATGWSGMFSAFTEVGGNYPVVVSAEYATNAGMTLKGNYTHNADTGAPAFTIGQWVSRLASNLQIEAPASLNNLTLSEFDLEFNTKTKDLLFVLGLELPLDGQIRSALVRFSMIHTGQTVEKKFHLDIAGLQFEVLDRPDLLLASYQGNIQIAPHDLVAAVSTQAAAVIPSSLQLTVQDAMFARKSDSAAPNDSKFLFTIELGARIDLSNLPLVGTAFAGDAFVVDQLRFLAASKPFDQAEVASLPATIVLPEKIAKGPAVGARISWTGHTEMFQADASTPAAAGQGGVGAAVGGAAAIPVAGNAKWFVVDRTFGPVHIQRIGGQYQNQELGFLLDGTLGVGAVALTLMGLQVGSQLTTFAPKFALNGLGLSIQTGSVGITGAFLRVHHDAAPPLAAFEEYAGTAIVSLQKLTLGALGSYAELDGHSSLFVYAVLDMPIGGPSFFFVTGLAAGFGFNRALRMPPIDEVAQFPFIQEAISGAKNLDVIKELQGIQRFVPPSIGDRFLAIGVKFTSFKVIESFALLAVSFGQHVEVDILGLSTLVMPTPEAQGGPEPLAIVQLALKATFLPDPGFLGVSAQLTSSSYILSKACHLTGGFAFYCWFGSEHPGDFALCIGGYHPSYRPPAHYPQVPRLGFNWQVTSELSISGQGYFALVPSAVMAGGRLDAVWQSGDLRAWFVVGADFLLAWKPYHYEARVYLDMGVSYTFSFFGRHTITVNVGADLSIWGPEFAGIARVHLWIVSFTVSFGPNPSTSRSPIPWSSFRGMLPEPSKRVSVAVEGGLVKKAPDATGGITHLGVINPKELAISIQSAVPISAVTGIAVGGAPTAFGITPMNVLNAASTVTVKITGPTAFQSAEPITKLQPSALWGNGGLDGTGRELTDPLLCGFRLRAPAIPEPAHTPSIERATLGFDTLLVQTNAGAPSLTSWQSAKTLASVAAGPANIPGWVSEPVRADYFDSLQRN